MASSSVTVDNYYPFDQGPGASANDSRWRAMARYFIPSGIIVGATNGFANSLVGTTLTIQSGAAWVDGYYGESTSSKTLTVTNWGLLSMRLVHSASPPIIELFYNDGSTVVPALSLTEPYDVPIAAMVGGALQDWRQWVQPGGQPLPGVIEDFAGSTAPLGSLLCQGQSLLRQQYPNLFTAIGTTWGSADGTHFNLPDLRGRGTIGSGTGTYSGATARALAAIGGEETHVLVLGELASHNHGGSITGGNASGTSSTDGTLHTHNVIDPLHHHTYGGQDASPPELCIKLPGTQGNSLVNGNPPGTQGVTFTSIDFDSSNVGVGTPTSLHTHGINVSATGTIPSAGSGTAHNNMAPFAVTNKVIWY